MAERCPLLGEDMDLREGWPIDVPDTCLIQCSDLMTEATREAGEWDDYLYGEPIPDGDVEFSHDSIALSSLQKTSQRTYSVVDRVTMDDGSWLEIGETTYTFECPHSSI